MNKSVGNLFDYVNWRGDLSLKQSEFNAVDGLILSVLSFFQFENYEDFTGKTLKYAVNALKNVPFSEKMKIFCFVQEETDKFIRRTVKMDRFKDIEILDYEFNYDEETKTQFFAVTFKLDDGSIFIAFRGTDDSLVGWQEDCNLAFQSPVPSQILAKEYTQKMYEHYHCPIWIGGQSKGGNLAIWAGANVSKEAQRAIKKIFNYDGPGFMDDFLESEGFKNVQEKIISFVPDSSIVGILMGHCDYLIVKSTAHSVFQHDPLTWNVVGKRFEYLTERSNSGKELDAKINGFIRTMNKEQTAKVVNRIFELMGESDIKSLDEIKKKKHEMLKILPKLTVEVVKSKSAVYSMDK